MTSKRDEYERRFAHVSRNRITGPVANCVILADAALEEADAYIAEAKAAIDDLLYIIAQYKNVKVPDLNAVIADLRTRLGKAGLR